MGFSDSKKFELLHRVAAKLLSGLPKSSAFRPIPEAAFFAAGKIKRIQGQGRPWIAHAIAMIASAFQFVVARLQI